MSTVKNPTGATRIGCDHAVVASYTEGADGTPTYGAIRELPGLIALNVNPNASVETLFYDDGPGDTAATVGKIDVEIEKNALTIGDKSFLLGHQLDTNGCLISGSTDVPIWVALGFRSLKSDGTYRFVWLYKGKFVDPEESNSTKGDSISFNTDTISGSFVKLNKDFVVGGKTVKPYKIEVDETEETMEIIAKWFTSPVLPNAVVA